MKQRLLCFGSIFSFIYIVSVIVVWWVWSCTKAIRVDELLHLHDIWLISLDILPYRDFFEHHACWYHLLLSPLAEQLDPARDRIQAMAFISATRSISLGFSLGGLAILALIGRIWANWSVGLLAVIFLTGVPFFIETAIETRPDVIAFVFWMGSLALTANTLKQFEKRKENLESTTNSSAELSKHDQLNWGSGRSDEHASSFEKKTPKSHGRNRKLLVSLIRCDFFWAGVLLGSAVMFTQKVLFTVTGMATTISIWVLVGKRNELSVRVLKFMKWVTGLFLPSFATWIFFLFKGSGFEFLYYNFIVNAKWKYHESALIHFNRFIIDSYSFLSLSLIGFIVVMMGVIKGRLQDWIGIMIVTTAIGWFLGLFLVIPVTDRQFYMLVLPLLALMAARGLLSGVSYLPRGTRAPFIAISIALSVIEPLRLSWYQIQHSTTFSATLENALWVVENTKRSDIIMDGWSGAGVFRPQAWYYGFIHHEIPPLISAAERDDMINNLETGILRPRIVADETHLLDLHPRFRDWVKENYNYDPIRRLWNRK